MPLNQEEFKRNLMKAMRADDDMEGLGQLYEGKLKRNLKKAMQSDWADDDMEVPRQTEPNNGKDKTQNEKDGAKNKNQSADDKSKKEGGKESADKSQPAGSDKKDQEDKQEQEKSASPSAKEETPNNKEEDKSNSTGKDQEDKQEQEKSASPIAKKAALDNKEEDKSNSPTNKEEAPADSKNNKQNDLSFGQKKMMSLYQNQTKRLERLQKKKGKEKSQKEEKLQKKLGKVKKGTVKAKKIQNRIFMEAVGKLYIGGIFTVFLIPVVWLFMSIHVFIAHLCNFNVYTNKVPIPKFTLKYHLIYLGLTALITLVVLIFLFGVWYITEYLF